MSGIPARAVWHELMTGDVESAKRYYAKLFDWAIHDVDMGTSTYPMIEAAGENQGGLVRMAEGDRPHWITYFTVDDVDAACERAKAGGGAVAAPRMDIPDVGCFAILRDPSGALFAPYQGNQPPGREPEAHLPAGRFCWDELLTDDVEAGRRFYGELFGWGTRPTEMGKFTYHVFMRGGKDAAGMMKMPPEAEASPFWLPYVAVDDVDVSMARVRDLGGCILAEREIPGVGRFAVTGDPQGATIAVWKRAGPGFHEPGRDCT